MHRKNIIKILNLFAFIGLMLIVINGCSVRKTDKEKAFEKIHSEISEQTNLSVDQEQSTIENSLIQKTDYSNWFNFDYKPLFDSSGNIMPLIIEQTKNGQTEKLVISGANVTGGKKESKQSERKKSETEEKKSLVANTKIDSKINFETKKGNVNKELFSFGPQSIYIICLLGITIVCAVLAFTGHWSWIQNVFNKIKKYFSKQQ